MNYQRPFYMANGSDYNHSDPSSAVTHHALWRIVTQHLSVDTAVVIASEPEETSKQQDQEHR